jgi:hypothetical protein
MFCWGFEELCGVVVRAMFGWESISAPEWAHIAKLSTLLVISLRCDRLLSTSLFSFFFSHLCRLRQNAQQ